MLSSCTWRQNSIGSSTIIFEVQTVTPLLGLHSTCLNACAFCLPVADGGRLFVCTCQVPSSIFHARDPSDSERSCLEVQGGRTAQTGVRPSLGRADTMARAAFTEPRVLAEFSRGPDAQAWHRGHTSLARALPPRACRVTPAVHLHRSWPGKSWAQDGPGQDRGGCILGVLLVR